MHIRQGTKRAGKRINDKGTAGTTFCGAALTGYDVLPADVKSMEGRRWYQEHGGCEQCLHDHEFWVAMREQYQRRA